jgi:hypothetical protein
VAPRSGMSFAKKKWQTPRIALLDGSEASTGAGGNFEQYCTPGGPFSDGFGGKLAYCVASNHRVYSHNTAHRVGGCNVHDSKSANACLAS